MFVLLLSCDIIVCICLLLLLLWPGGPQVQYSLLYRRPETNGVLEACRENDVTLVAYSPLCQGLLTGGWLGGGGRGGTCGCSSRRRNAGQFLVAGGVWHCAWLVHGVWIEAL